MPEVSLFISLWDYNSYMKIHMNLYEIYMKNANWASVTGGPNLVMHFFSDTAGSWRSSVPEKMNRVVWKWKMSLSLTHYKSVQWLNQWLNFTNCFSDLLVQTNELSRVVEESDQSALWLSAQYAAGARTLRFHSDQDHLVFSRRFRLL